MSLKFSDIQSINIKNACHQDWLQMDKTDLGRHCHSCQKEVIDFTQLSTEEILDYFTNKKEGSTCGRFEKSQLRTLNPPLRSNYLKKKALALFSSLILTATSIYGQSEEPKTHPRIEFLSIPQDSGKISGVLVDEEGQPLIAATVVILETSQGTITDLDGKFSLDVSKVNAKHATLETHYVGYESFQVKMHDLKENQFRIILPENDEMILGEIIVQKRPIHQRVWRKMKRLVNRKEH